MRYVQRDQTGKVIGHYANAQSYATECIPDDHPDIEAYKAAVVLFKDPSVEVRVPGTLRRSPFALGLTRVLAAHLGIPEAELVDQIIAAALETRLPVE